MRYITPLLVAAAVSASWLIPAAHAQTPLANREPGLWELRLVDGTRLAAMALSMERTLKSLPEERRRQMMQLMGGSDITLPTVIRQCLTPEMARSDIRPQLAEHDIHCSTLEWQESGDSGEFSFVCTNPQGKWSGKGRISDATPRSFTSQASVEGTYRGQQLAFDMTHEARWLGADCGDVRPPK